MKTKDYLILCTIFVVGAILLVFQHESVHWQINRTWDLEQRFVIDWATGSPGVAHEPCPTNECQLAHNINEVVGYHFIMLYVIVGLFVMFLLSLKIREDI